MKGKTTTALLARRAEGTILCVGHHEVMAAHKLAASGLAIFDNQSQLIAGRSYWNCFTRSWATAKPRADAAGYLTFI